MEKSICPQTVPRSRAHSSKEWQKNHTLIFFKIKAKKRRFVHFYKVFSLQALISEGSKLLFSIFLETSFNMIRNFLKIS